MAARTFDWMAFRVGIWCVALGTLAGIAAHRFAPPNGAWYFAGAAVVVATAAALIGRSSRRREVSRSVSNGEHQMLAFLPPLAREVLERLPDPLMLLDSAGRVVFANKAMVSVVGTDTQKKHVSAVLRTPTVLQAIDRTAATGESAAIDFSFRVPVERHFQAYVTRIEQTPRLTAVLLHDVTSAKRAEEARADFVANASHELKTPLAAVSGFIDTLKGHARDDEGAREKFLDIMGVEAGRMRRLIDDLLSLTRIEQNEHVPPSGDVNIVDVARDAAAALQGLARLDDVTIIVGDGAGIPHVIGARDELIQLFQNLIHNAIKYGKVGGKICINFAVPPSSVAPAGRRNVGTMVAISVKDDGEGIPREAIPRLTERFYRVDVKRSRERGGTGLGLAIVKHIVNRHRGRLDIDSRASEGSTFTVLLPAVSAAEVFGAPAVMEVL
jgi:two-component system, OmpR family, phosphate regulon sensor histidine kinase PhoR